MTRRVHSAGFTLLETMVAMGIMASGLTILFYSQTLAMRSVGRAKMITAATMLARARIVSLEDEMRQEGFSDFVEEDSGDFSDEGFEQFRWTTKVEKIELPSGNVDSDATEGMGALTGITEGMSEQAADAAEQAMGGMASAMAGAFELIRETLEGSIRKVTVTVLWNEGPRERNMFVEAYFTNPAELDAAAALSTGLLGGGGSSGGAASGGASR